MKKTWKYIFAGFITALGGLFASELSGHFFNGMDYGSACVLGVCLYLCAVVVTCTGVILSKLNGSTSPENRRDGE